MAPIATTSTAAFLHWLGRQYLFEGLGHSMGDLAVGTRPRVDHIEEILAEIPAVLGAQQRKQIDQRHPLLRRDFTSDPVALGDVAINILLAFDRVFIAP